MYKFNEEELALFQQEPLFNQAMRLGWEQQKTKEQAQALLIEALFKIKREQDKREIERIMRAPSIPVINMKG
ncbi:conserved hypothetical protein [Vibrio phage 22O28-1]|nr:conserved hypothetical protein [Vibrio phage 22O28-1]